MRKHDLANDVPSGGTHDSKDVNVGLINLASPNKGVKKNEKIHHHGNQSHLRRDAYPKPNHKERGQGDSWNPVHGRDEWCQSVSQQPT